MLFLLDKLSKFDANHIVYAGDMHHLVTSFPYKTLQQNLWIRWLHEVQVDV